MMLPVLLIACCLSPPSSETDWLEPRPDKVVVQIDDALRLASKFLIERQEEDGSWKSRTYGILRDDLSLTPFVLTALHNMPQDGGARQASVDKGVNFLLTLIDEDGKIAAGSNGLRYPTYTAAAASWAVMLRSKSPRNLQAQQAWIEYLKRRQLTERIGWRKTDPQFGGWGYDIGIPAKPGSFPGRQPESNLSATVFAIGALRAARVTTDKPIFKDILLFVERCQNFPDDSSNADPQFDDGGFFFSPTDPARNKAGVAGTDMHGKIRFHSYGSMTADGLRALIRCELPFSHPRLKAARRWLEYNFRADTNPGAFQSVREPLRDAYYYYYCWSVAHAFMALGVEEIHTKDGTVNWARELAEELLRRQRPDGSWSNHYTDAMEDDPLIATPFAAAALAICSRVLTQG